MPPFGVSAQAHTRSASELATARCAPIPSTATLIAMAAAALAQEAKDRADFVVAQRAAGMLSDDLVQGQVHALLRSIRSSGHVAVSDATVVTNALVAGPWSPAQMGALASAVGDLSVRAQKGGTSTAARAQQKFSVGEMHACIVSRHVCARAHVRMPYTFDYAQPRSVVISLAISPPPPRPS